MPRQATFGELLAKLNRDVALLNAHYENSRWLADMGEQLEAITANRLVLTLDVVDYGRRFRVDPEEVLGIKNLAQISAHLQEQETSTGMDKIITVAESVREIYDLAFPRDGTTDPRGAHADETVQPVQSTKAGK